MKPRKRARPVAERVRAYLCLAHGQPRHYTHIATMLRHPNSRQVGHVCEQLVAEGHVEACGEGFYQIAPETSREGGPA